MEINFIESPRLPKGAVRRLVTRQILGVVLSVSYCALLGWYLSGVARGMEVSNAVGEFSDPNNLSHFQGALAQVERKVEDLRSALQSRAMPHRALQLLRETIPDGVSIQSVVARGSRIDIAGDAKSEGDARTFVRRLEEYQIVDSVVVVASEVSVSGGERVVLFRVRANVTEKPMNGSEK